MLLVTARVLGLNPGYFYILSIFEIYIYINKNFCIFQKKSLKLSKNQTGWMKLKLLCSMKYLWNNTDFSLILHWQKISRKSGKFLGYRSGALNSLSIERIREGLKIVKFSLSFGIFSKTKVMFIQFLKNEHLLWYVCLSCLPNKWYVCLIVHEA